MRVVVVPTATLLPAPRVPSRAFPFFLLTLPFCLWYIARLNPQLLTAMPIPYAPDSPSGSYNDNLPIAPLPPILRPQGIAAVNGAPNPQDLCDNEQFTKPGKANPPVPGYPSNY